MTLKKIKKTNVSIAIVGRPNVGKSTLFNRLIGERKAVVFPEAGTTRDRIEHQIEINKTLANLVDTGGLMSGKKKNKSEIQESTEKQAKKGIELADIIVFLVDATEGLTPEDQEVARLLRGSKRNVILVANKCDNQKFEQNTFEFFKLGFGEPLMMSAIHNIGLDSLKEELERLVKKIKKPKIKIKQETDEKKLFVSIIGRPNVGKSSLLNSLLGEERVVVSDVPGTTRDSTDTEIEYKDHKIVLVDTAGIRRRGKIEQGIENFSFIRTQESIDRSDIVIVLMDATEVAAAQDLHVIQMATESRKGLIIGINKMDLADTEQKENIQRILSYKCDFIPWAPLHFISAKNKKNIFQIMDSIIEVAKNREIQIPTSRLNAFMQKTIMKSVPASSGILKCKFFYANQVSINPPKFYLFFKNAKGLHFSYKRYIENEMRKEFGFHGTPISLTFRENSPKER